ncbi:MAG: helix-turn-helix domain-containing protein [Alphaproteobacteria bacterium]|nr:helix-turn-helix domain-containing protein [Alphaproteobacteria bacterium]
MNITGRQIRAARGLLGLKMEELADKAGLTRITIRQIENETVQPQEKSMAKIYAVFDKFGVEFLPDEGMRIRKQDVRSYSGKAGYRQFLDHVFETLKKGGNIRQFNFGDMRYLPNEEAFVADHFLRMGTINGLDARVIETENETKHKLQYCDYRNLDKKFKDMSPWYLYGEYLTLSLYEAGGKREFITIRSKLLTERYLKEFDIFWNMATPDKKNATRTRR